MVQNAARQIEPRAGARSRLLPFTQEPIIVGAGEITRQEIFRRRTHHAGPTDVDVLDGLPTVQPGREVARRGIRFTHTRSMGPADTFKIAMCAVPRRARIPHAPAVQRSRVHPSPRDSCTRHVPHREPCLAQCLGRASGAGSHTACQRLRQLLTGLVGNGQKRACSRKSLEPGLQNGVLRRSPPTSCHRHPDLHRVEVPWVKDNWAMA